MSWLPGCTGRPISYRDGVERSSASTLGKVHTPHELSMKLSRMRTRWNCVPIVTRCAPRLHERLSVSSRMRWSVATPCVERVDPAARKLPGALCTRNIGTGSADCRSSPVVVAVATSSFVHAPRALVARTRVVALEAESSEPLPESCQPFWFVGVRASTSPRPSTHPCVSSIACSIDGCQESLSSRLWFDCRSTGAAGPSRVESQAVAKHPCGALGDVIADSHRRIARRGDRIVRAVRLDVGDDEIVQPVAHEGPPTLTPYCTSRNAGTRAPSASAPTRPAPASEEKTAPRTTLVPDRVTALINPPENPPCRTSKGATRMRISSMASRESERAPTLAPA